MDPWVRKIRWRRDRLSTPVFLGFPCGSAGKESACNAGDLGSIPGFEKIPWRRERLLTPVFWPGEFHGLYSPWSLKVSDMAERLSLHFHFPASSWQVQLELGCDHTTAMQPGHPLPSPPPSCSMSLTGACPIADLPVGDLHAVFHLIL